MELFLQFLGTLRETLKIFFKNGKLMASITLIALVLNSLLYLVQFFSIKILIGDSFKEQNLVLVSTPGSPEFTNVLIYFIPEFTNALIHSKQDLGTFIGVQWTYLAINSIFSLFLSTLTILGSAVIHEANDSITFKNLILKSLRSWKRTFVTLFYTIVGFSSMFFLFIFPLSLGVKTTTSYTFYAILVAIPFLISYLQMGIVWTLALVISVLEEICGLEAIRKAAQIVEGMKINGFLLNLVFTIIFSVVIQCIRWTGIPQPTEPFKLLIGYLVINSISCLVRTVWLVAYTLFYYQCKKTHGEEVDSQKSVEYSKIATKAPLLIGENIP
ncbi:hypothetical protein JCGZ_07819 [Jatropha curcas]|uniref:Transmembrane protein n=1 Tax=Jatropha curcas TaxID=180498 RepID=A0A067KGZ9_JATCU|nr:hypothetical protein JCGZ_07819 [Jatropha curcas]